MFVRTSVGSLTQLRYVLDIDCDLPFGVRVDSVTPLEGSPSLLKRGSPRSLRLGIGLLAGSIAIWRIFSGARSKCGLTFIRRLLDGYSMVIRWPFWLFDGY